MFSSKEPRKSSSGAIAPTINIISEGTRIEGDVRSENDIRISGTVKGEAISKGRVIVTSSGVITGNIRAKDADIAGKLEGELFIGEKLILRQTAVITGDIHTRSLLVEEGAQISGNCKMGVESRNGTGTAQDAALARKLKESTA